MCAIEHLLFAFVLMITYILIVFTAFNHTPAWIRSQQYPGNRGDPMAGNVAPGVAILLLAGAMNASFTLPMKFTRKWAWENIWAAWSLWALLLLPALTAYLSVPRLNEVYAQAGMEKFALVAACGVSWGVAQVLFGLAIDSIGIALAFTIVMGLSAASGSLFPLLQLHENEVLAPAGIRVIEGVGLVLAGVFVCAIAGRKREAARSVPARSVLSTSSLSMPVGLACAVLSGLGASAMNFGLAFGGAMMKAAEATGASPAWRTNTVWFPLMAAGAIPNLLYCLFLLCKKKTLENFSRSGTRAYWGVAALMACLWFGSSLLYGAASEKLGELGPILGWPVFMSMIVIVASALGFITGEWKHAGKMPWRIQLVGVAILLIAVVVLSRAGQSRTTEDVSRSHTARVDATSHGEGRRPSTKRMGHNFLVVLQPDMRETPEEFLMMRR
jgi:L-rhamnose-H+ transport protein